MDADRPDPKMLAAMVVEMTGLAPCEIVFQPDSLLEMVSIVQLAMRHPHFAEHGDVALKARRFIEGARVYFSRCPTVLRVIAMGDDPACDRVN